MSLDVKCAKCGDGTCGGPLVMHGRCHMGSPTYAELVSDKLTLYCSECNERVGTFIVETVDLPESGDLSPVCHKLDDVWVVLHNNEDLIIQCAVCDLPIAKFKMLGIAKSGVA